MNAQLLGTASASVEQALRTGCPPTSTSVKRLLEAVPAFLCRLVGHRKIVAFADVGSPVMACSRCMETWAACLPSSEDV